MIQELKDSYGHLFEQDLLDEISTVGSLKEVPEGFLLMDIGQYIKSMPLLVHGAIKILRDDDEGDELLLYFLERGDTCAMTLTCCLGETRSEIRAIAETEAKLIMVPIQKMEEWTSKYKTWRDFVFKSYHSRMMEMLDTIDSIAFMKMDERLVKHLKDKAKVIGSNVIQTTHQDMAYDMHTSRVVISRLLKTLENQGKVKLGRNSIEIISLD
ncbi:MAG: Crp/Fnr family transcriptional regulator [Flavobacteriales bacterium]|nr:Crp/Fnr family transcriptional regulator [Flavobacteriales bacterium]MDG1766333.1 Crp/Fnr family transcriptional regulator [Flavobacteriales bacterium]